MTPHRSSLAAIAVGLLGAPAPAVAAWSAPRSISAPHTFITPLRLAEAGGGTLLATWGFQDGIGGAARVGDRGAALAPGSSAFARERTLTTGTVGVATYASSRTVALWQRAAGAQSRLGVRFGSARTLRFGTSRVLAQADIHFVPQLAMSARGEGLVAWIERSRTHPPRRIVRVSQRPAGGSFGRPATILGTGRADALAVAIGPDGDRVVVVARNGRLVARVRRPGHGWGSVQDLGPVADQTDNHLTAVVAAELPRIVVVDVHRQLSEGGEVGRTFVDGWVLPAGHGRFGLRQRLDSGAVPALDPRLAVGPAGAWLAWVGPGPEAPGIPEGGGTRARVAHLSGVRFDAPQEVSPAGDAVKGLGLRDTAAGTIVSWVRIDASSDGNGTVFAAIRPSSGDAFPAAEAVSGQENAQTTEPAIAGGAPVVVWVSRPEGEGLGVPLASIRTLVRVATRPS